jgi:hypothetical protein
MWPPLWPSGQSFCLQIQWSGFNSRRYQIFWVVGLERSALERKNSGSSLENPDYGRLDPSHSPRGATYPQTLVLTSLTSGGRSVGIVRSRTQATEFIIFNIMCLFGGAENAIT